MTFSLPRFLVGSLLTLLVAPACSSGDDTASLFGPGSGAASAGAAGSSNGGASSTSPIGTGGSGASTGTTQGTGGSGASTGTTQGTGGSGGDGGSTPGTGGSGGSGASTGTTQGAGGSGGGASGSTGTGGSGSGGLEGVACITIDQPPTDTPCAGGQIGCCVRNGPNYCSSPQQCNGFGFAACDGPEDCAGGVCCVGKSNYELRCRTSCGSNENVVCHPNPDGSSPQCNPGQKCVEIGETNVYFECVN